MEIPPLQLELAQPWWLLALGLTPWIVLWARRGLTNLPRGWQAVSIGLRIALVVCLVAAVSDVRHRSDSRRRFVVVAVDRSASVGPSARREASQFAENVAKANSGDRVVFLNFAATPGEFGDEPIGLDPQATNLAAAIEKSLLATPAGYSPGVVLVTDGLANKGDVGDVVEAAQLAGAAISTVLLDSAADAEAYVEGLIAPSQVRRGEHFWVDVEIYSTVAQQGKVRLTVGELLLDEQETRVGPGSSRVRFHCPAMSDQTTTCVATISGFRDGLTENNRASAVVLPSASPRVLLVQSESGSAPRLARALAEGNLDVETRAPEAFPLTVDELRPYDLLILSNLPAESLTERGMQAVDDYVARAGGGLLVVGGYQSLTPGGYHHTPLEGVLPVWCESPRTETRPGLAMALVIDRSASMREGGAIDLAKAAVRRVINLLEGRDQLGVIAFDDSSRWILPMAPCDDKARMLAEINTLSASGRTDMYPALEKAFLALQEAFAERKHIMVLTDGVSHPGDFDAICERIAAAGITLSTVAVGRETAAGLLEHLAAVGGGHFYACDNPAALPSVFALETASAGGLGIWEKPFFARRAAPSAALERIAMDDAPSLLGYAETTAKPAARVLMTSEQGDPLLACWRYGAGTCVVFTSDAQPRWARSWLEWDGFAPFWRGVARLALRRPPPETSSLEVRRLDGRTLAVLDVAGADGQPRNGEAPVLWWTTPDGAVVEKTTKQTAPGRYTAELSASESGVHVVEARLDSAESDAAAIARRAFVVDYPNELRVRPADPELLESIASQTGGRFNPEADGLFPVLDRGFSHTTFLWTYFLAAAVVVMLLDVALRRAALTRCNAG